jgi:hypothetical protein
VLRLLAHWEAHRTGPAGAAGAEAPRHPVCGTPLEARWFCPTCDEAIEDPAEGELRWL